MSETKHTPLPEPFNAVVQYFDKQAKCDRLVRELLSTSKDIVTSFRRCMEVTGSDKEYIDIRLAPAEKAIREVEAALGGKAE